MAMILLGRKKCIEDEREGLYYGFEMDVRARKAGIALKAQKKLDDRYNEEEKLGTPDRLVAWMNAVLEGTHAPCPSSQWRKIHFYLRDGVVLCKFICKLRVAAGMDSVKFMANAHTPFVAMENISVFNKAAMDYGVEEEATFQSADLYEGQTKGALINVINCLNRLGFVANSKGFTPSYEFMPPPTHDDDHWTAKA
ncbi:hypothetical protein CAPTEDRAFT_225727 [Capitella teleta]|uniref:Calponin-homology (CH) domain-containing protein n=1 Tax=Capitella teleta TaxID=283909 RepID=R7UZT5_CAPTE|nr:hypothetical protein CAPTEDRAFT_225727 [Capitella teleta]|eukprot:ELU08951.1 hypothetical protein CAPTEDRAFT_225727 [Capitella teleta]